MKAIKAELDWALSVLCLGILNTEINTNYKHTCYLYM